MAKKQRPMKQIELNMQIQFTQSAINGLCRNTDVTKSMGADDISAMALTIAETCANVIFNKIPEPEEEKAGPGPQAANDTAPH